MKPCKRVHHRKEPFDILIDRSTKWGCPFSNKPHSTAPFKVKTRKEAIEKHKEWLIHGDGQYLLKDLHELKGKTLGCWCNKNQSCHGDILVELVNNLNKPTLNEFFIMNIKEKDI